MCSVLRVELAVVADAVGGRRGYTGVTCSANRWLKRENPVLPPFTALNGNTDNSLHCDMTGRYKYKLEASRACLLALYLTAI